MREQGQKVSESVRNSIARCIERIQLAGDSVLILPGQFAAMMCVRRYLAEPLEHSENFLQGRLTDDEIGFYFRRCKESGAPVIGELVLTEDKNLLRELYLLARLVGRECDKRGSEAGSVLENVMEYLLETIQQVRGREYFFTPSAVAELMIGLLRPTRGAFWDPACGSGTLLCEAAKLMRRESGAEGSSIRGTDISSRMREVAGSNLWIREMAWDWEETGIPAGGSLRWAVRMNWPRLETGDAFEIEEQFDYIAANPPVSSVHAVAGATRGHIALTGALHLQFLQHIMKSLKESGRAVVLVNEGVLFSRKSAERAIRRVLVERHGLRAVVSLPPRAFAPYTHAKASILLFEGEGRGASEVFFYDVERLGYSLDKNRCPQEGNDIPDVLEKESGRGELYDRWRREKGRSSVYNSSGVEVPEDWAEKKVWFADPEQIRQREYDLLPATYRPRQEIEEQEPERPEELMRELLAMEREIQERLERISSAYDG